MANKRYSRVHKISRGKNGEDFKHVSEDGLQIKMINAWRCNKNENSGFRKRGNVDC